MTKCLEFSAGAIDVSRLAPGQAAFASGWVLPAYKGVRQLDMRVLLSRGDCELLRDACRRLIVDLGEQPEFGKTLEEVSVHGRTGGALGALVDDARADVATHLAARHELVFRKDSVLRLTQVQVNHMSEQERRRRLDLVALALRRLLEFERDDRSWFQVNGIDYGFAAEEVLP